jgi:cell division protein FtsQ
MLLGRMRWRPGPRLIAAVVGILLLLGGAFVWFRDSSLVAVHDVKVTGASGPDAGQIRSALVTAARNMTTLDVNMGQLQTAVKPYPDVKHLEVSTQFPHGMRIRVVEQMPVAVLDEGGQKIAVAGDGTLLHDVVPKSPLPQITLPVPPGGQQLTGAALAEVRLLAAAPYQLLSKVGGVTDGAAHGLVVRLRNGPSIYFGDTAQLSAKWNAAAAVLASAGSSAPVYIDVTDPSRPAAGAGADTSATSSGATSGSTGASN